MPACTSEPSGASKMKDVDVTLLLLLKYDSCRLYVPGGDGGKGGGGAGGEGGGGTGRKPAGCTSLVHTLRLHKLRVALPLGKAYSMKPSHCVAVTGALHLHESPAQA